MNDLRWHMEAAIERLLELPHEDRREGTIIWSALFFLHEGLAGKPAGMTAKGSRCMICGARPGEPHRGLPE